MKAHLQTYVRQRISTEDERKNIFAIKQYRSCLYALLPGKEKIVGFYSMRRLSVL